METQFAFLIRRLPWALEKQARQVEMPDMTTKGEIKPHLPHNPQCICLILSSQHASLGMITVLGRLKSLNWLEFPPWKQEKYQKKGAMFRLWSCLFFGFAGGQHPRFEIGGSGREKNNQCIPMHTLLKRPYLTWVFCGQGTLCSDLCGPEGSVEAVAMAFWHQGATPEALCSWLLRAWTQHAKDDWKAFTLQTTLTFKTRIIYTSFL